MPAPTPKDSVIVAQVLTELAKIGTGPTQWLTNPPDAKEGAPGDALDGTIPHQIFIQCAESALEDAPVTATMHARRLTVTVWMIAQQSTSSWAEVRKIKADVLRALYAAEGTFESISLEWGVQGYQARNDLAPAGFLAGSLDVYFDYDSEHATP